MMEVWTDYSVTPPPVAGVYEWSVPLAVDPSMTVTVLAHMRKRGAGYSDVISPVFDHWDGYRVTVPAGTHWRPATTVPDDFPTHRETIIGVGGCEFDKCPFCHKVPRLVGLEKFDRSVSLGANAYQFNTWWLECCSWAKSPHMKSPRALAEARHAMLTEGRS